MSRVREDFQGRPRFDNTAGIHDQHARAEARDEGDVVRD
jgi:hypothetical protein